MKKLWSRIDKPLFILTIIFTLLGLVMIYSSSSISSVLRYDRPSYYFFEKQLIFVILSFICGIFILKTPTKYYKGISYFLLLVFSLILVSLVTKKILTNNASSWYYIGSFGFQPSEFVKSFSILTMAFYYGKLFQKGYNNIISIFIPIVIYVACAVLIMLQPDLGSALIYAGIIGAMFLSLPFKEKFLVKAKRIIPIVAVVLLYFLLFGSSFLNQQQSSRLNFQNPCSRYTDETGYQVCNGFIAIKNGGLFGMGLGNSTQKYLYLPESHTDFIFPIIVEELGLVVGVLVILGYIFMLLRIYKISKKATNLRNQLICYGVFIYFSLHMIINLVGITALLPLTGVPLPFLSYGGSFIVNVLCMTFVCQRICYETNTENLK